MTSVFKMTSYVGLFFHDIPGLHWSREHKIIPMRELTIRDLNIILHLDSPLKDGRRPQENSLDRKTVFREN